MKTLSIIYIGMTIVCLLAGSAFSAEYSIDVLEPGNLGGWTSSSKTYDNTYKTEAGEIFEVDIWIKDAPGSANGGGAFIDFRGFTDKISYVSCQRYDNGVEELPGPWQADAGNTINEPDTLGEGTLIVLVGNLSAVAPDGDGDIIIAKVTFQCLIAGAAEIMVRVVPSMPTWAPSPPWDDGNVKPLVLTISPLFPPESSTTTTSIDASSTSSTTLSSSTSTALTTTSIKLTTSTTTVSIPISICLVEEIFGENSQEVEMLRFFRDHLLNKTPSGREIIKMYNKWNYTMIKFIREDGELREQLRQILNQIILIVRVIE